MPQTKEKIRQVFKIDDLKGAIDEAFKAKYVEGWAGHVELESNGKDIILCHFAGSNSWVQGYQTVFALESWRTFSDEISELENMGDGKWQDYSGEIRTAEEILNYVDIENIVDLDQIQERLDDIVEETEVEN